MSVDVTVALAPMKKHAEACFRILEIWKFGGAVGVLPPESEKPDQRFLQAQLRI
jgi:hypothetical protein